MKNMKKLFLLLSVAVLSAGNMKADETRTFTHDNEDYSINTLWINLDAVSDYYQKFYNGENWLYSPFFFVKDDVIYMTKDASGTQSTSLMAIDGKSGNFKEIVPIDWGNITPNSVAAVYGGVDSKGTCYVASYGTSTSDDYPFIIYPLEFTTAGQPKAVGQYKLEMGANWWIKSVEIHGSLMEGNFTVTSLIWDKMRVGDNETLRSSIGMWQYSQYQQTARKEYVQPLTVCDIFMVADNKIIVHDRHNVGNQAAHSASAIAATPSLFTIDENGMNLHSSIESSDDDDNLGNGMAVFTLGEDKHFMVYASSGLPVEFKLLALPDYPESLANARIICTLTPKSVGLGIDPATDDREKTGVFIEKKDDNTATIYVTGNKRGMAAYTIKREAPLNTGVESITTDEQYPIEYYTVTGLQIPEKPSAGFYIEKRGPKTAKKFAK